MSASLRGYRRLIAEWLAITLLLAGFAAACSMRGWLTPLNHLVYDGAISFAQQPVPQDVVLVAIDDDSIAQLGKWPWRRDVHAALLDILTRNGARAIALDILMTEPAADPGSDLVLAQAMQRSGRVVLPIFRAIRRNEIRQEMPPIPQLAQASAGLGHIEASVDEDGVLRAYQRFAGTPGALHPHLAIRLLEVAGRAQNSSPQPAVIRLDAAAPVTDSQPNRLRRIPFVAPAGSFASLSYADVLKGKFPASAFQDKIVLVGAFATGLGDAYAVPAARGHGEMPGVEIIANILAGERSQSSITTLGPVPAAIVSTLLPLGVMLLLPSLRNRIAVLLVSAMMLATCAVAIALPQVLGVWWPPAGALIALMLAYPLWSWRCLNTVQDMIDDELARVSMQVGPSQLPPARAMLIARMYRIRALRLRLDAAQDQREETLRFISHDLRAPLASLITLMESVASKYGSDPARPWLATMRERADRALAMADDFLRLARAESISEQNFAPCCLVAVVDEAIDEFWPQANVRQVTIARDYAVPDAEAPMLGEAGLLRRAFANLLSNAIRHAPPCSRIRVGLRPDGNTWIVTVADQGTGIAEQDLPKLFGRTGKKFGTAPIGSNGTGLGLLIVRTVIERHGGSVAASSTAGEGATFTVWLPAAA